MKSNTSQRNSPSTGWHKVRNTGISIAVGYQQTTKLNHSNLDSLGWDAGVYGTAARIVIIEVSNQDICQVNVIPVSAHPPLGVRDYLATALFAASWLFEIVADHQKTTWRRRKENKDHDEKFITGGLWSLSRHPKYVI
ncbi:hypothetical protein PHLCEN_2v11167 [Hermanssonia centrifuga]|uniref:Uncharacterized protein n=1 Tax=Hermanssonia centrifuga TaxID=98765 RepID=A0A2R6NKM9_9APHY|nr:hypothetical protein PHLCEN_2v11167 [Hermanssonia centrifuga]